ncbi:MAG: ABC transporter substrate-binding protein, partial [Chloroflexota bacterium]|nr:ABC transporter substrate-binding protein [Chloroflexota bacterium]
MAMADHGRSVSLARVHSRAYVNQGTVTLVTDGSTADLDPASEELAASDMVDININETLVTLKGSSVSQVIPDLAASWRITNHGKTYIFNLRHGVRFHTGRLMTAADVVYSLARTIKAGLTNSYLLPRFISNPGKQIRALNPYTVEFDLSRPQQFFLPALADNYVCDIIDSHALKAHAVKGDYGHAYATSHDLG